MSDIWSAGHAYDRFMGRWSRLLAPMFVDWMGQPPGLRWADLGCGTGALSAAIVSGADPASVLAIDPSAGFLETAAAEIADPRMRFRQGSVELLEAADHDVVVCGLVLNFLPDPEDFLRAAGTGVVGAYVWDYAGGHPMLQHFWEAAARVAGQEVTASENTAFGAFTEESLAETWRVGGLRRVSTTALELEMVFADFDDYWTPFLGGTGPAPAYLATLEATEQQELRAVLAEELAGDENRDENRDGRIRLHARAWAVRGESVGSRREGALKPR